jgi:hypothetical protein
MGNAAVAQEHSNKAKMFSMIATIIGAVGLVISFIIGWRFGFVAFPGVLTLREGTLCVDSYQCPAQVEVGFSGGSHHG